MKKNKALLVVDVQKDFCPGGALPVPGGDRVVAALNPYMEQFAARNFPVLVSRDWHPPHTTHFKDFGGQWPVHCVQDTDGAAFHHDLQLPRQSIVISKGMDPEQDSYSAFQGSEDKGTPMAQILLNLKVEELYVGGLATDYCVKASCLDGIRKGFKVFLLMDAIAGVDLHPQDSHAAIQEMLARGVKKMTVEEFKRLWTVEKQG